MKKIFAINLFLLFWLAGAFAQAKKVPAARAGAASAKPSRCKGKLVFTTYCLSCHQADGGGVSQYEPAPSLKTKYVLGDKTKLVNILLKGLNEEIEIEGSTYSNPMPAHDFLKDEDIANVLSFVRKQLWQQSFDGNNGRSKKTARSCGEIKGLNPRTRG